MESTPFVRTGCSPPEKTNGGRAQVGIWSNMLSVVIFGQKKGLPGWARPFSDFEGTA